MTQGGNMHSFSTSSVMTMSTGPDGRPQVIFHTYSSTIVSLSVHDYLH